MCLHRLRLREVDRDLPVRRHLDAELLQGTHELLLLRLTQIAELEVARLQLLLKDL